jgi:hypothetical protein
MKKLLGLKPLNVLILSCLMAVVDGCVTKAPTYNQAEIHMPRLKAGYARVFLYCNQPSETTRPHDFVCSVDDQPVGLLSTREFLFTDHTAGRCEIKAKAGSNPLLPSQHVVLDLEPGDVRYVRMDMKFTVPVQINLKIVDAEKGEEDVQTCVYMGKSLPSHAMR